MGRGMKDTGERDGGHRERDGGHRERDGGHRERDEGQRGDSNTHILLHIATFS